MQAAQAALRLYCRAGNDLYCYWGSLDCSSLQIGTACAALKSCVRPSDNSKICCLGCNPQCGLVPMAVLLLHAAASLCLQTSHLWLREGSTCR